MRLLFLITSFLAFVILASGQAPKRFKYQAVLRDPSGQIIKEQLVKVRISIRKGTPTGQEAYRETHTATTNANGLINLEIGSGTANIGSLAAIAWTQGPFFVNVGLDRTGGENFIDLGTSQLLSVPYALHANFADSANVKTSLAQVLAVGNDGGAKIIRNLDGLFVGSDVVKTDAALEIASSTKGFLPPRLTVEERDKIKNPSPGLVIFNKTSGCLNYHNAGSWFELCGQCVPQPSAAVAGADMLEVVGTTVTLSAIAPAVGKGKWSIVTGAGGTFQNDTVPTTLFNGIKGNTYNLRWTVANSCRANQDEVVINFSAGDPKIGDEFEGGIIAWLNTGSRSAMVVSKTDLASDAVWGCPATNIGTIDGPGGDNTLKIVQQCGPNTAGKLCDDYSAGGSSNWHLPSLGELYLVYYNLARVGKGGFTDGVYWSSTEESATTAWSQNMANGQGPASSKTSALRVRAVRFVSY